MALHALQLVAVGPETGRRQIGAARGTTADQARVDYREWAEGQHDLLSYGDGRFGISDAEYAAAIERSGLTKAERHEGQATTAAPADHAQIVRQADATGIALPDSPAPCMPPQREIEAGQ
jgi:hypothetical protein